FFDYIRDVNKNYNFDLYRYEGRSVDFFENILYYNYLEKYFENEYTFYDFKNVIEKLLPQDISHRFKLDELPFSLFGNDYLLNILAPNEVHYLSSLFEEFKLPFIRLEPPLFSPEYFPELKKLPYFTATISSHHHVWMNKKIAICISGEFRHVVHRTPEQQVRTIKSFLSGVDCDVYLHGWHNTSEALIIHELKPKKYLFEDQKSFWDLERQIKFREPRLKAGRDHGSLSMFYSIQKSFELIENYEDYDYVVRIRPDVYPDLSLKEILVKISDEGDFIENAIYFPKCYHSKGINDQFAIGNIKSMDHYFKTFDYIKNNIDKLFFNPESILLKNILENAIKPAVIDFPYALMRHLPFRVHEISRVMHDQENVWWSRTDSLPALTDLSQFFRDKLRSMEASMTGLVPDVLFFPFKVAEYPRGHVWVEVKNDDNNPSKAIAAYFISKQEAHVSHCVINENYVEFIRDFQKHTFIFKEKNCFIFSQWRFVGNSFCNVRKKFPISRVLKDNPLSFDSMAKAWRIYDQMQEDENNGIHVSRPVEKFQSKKISSNIDVESSALKISLFFLDKIISERLRNKLHNNPELFFKDAKNPLSKIIGKSFFKERNRKNNI
ncbi:hypothetical protein, partial [Zymomonas sp.]|uniref:hypothetical protein n=1 Tax=Zymomonas sp. TaxID=2068624 RepID=UPI0025D07A96